MEHTTFTSAHETAENWASLYRPLSETHEMAAILYSRAAGGRKIYYYGRTYRGMRKRPPIQPNVILPFLYLYLVEATRHWLRYGAQIEAFLHTHPKPDSRFSYNHPSKADRWLLLLPMLKTVYIIPWENQELLKISSRK